MNASWIIHSTINELGQLVLSSPHAPDGSVIRCSFPWEGARVLVTKGEYMAPIDPLPGAEIRFRLFSGKHGISETFSHLFPGVFSHSPRTLIPCTQNRDFIAYDWGTRFRATLGLSREIRPNLVLLGDSITHFWGGDPLDPPSRVNYLNMASDVWQSVFSGYRAVNMGFGNDRVENVLWRVRHGALDDVVSNATVILLIGTNNLAEDSVEDIALGIKVLCKEILECIPDGKLLLQHSYPRENKLEERASLRHLVDAISLPRLTLIDPGMAIEDGSTGKPATGMTRDGLHPTHAGYEALAHALKTYL